MAYGNDPLADPAAVLNSFYQKLARKHVKVLYQAEGARWTILVGTAFINEPPSLRLLLIQVVYELRDQLLS